MASKDKNSPADDILPKLKEVYGFMAENGLDSIEVDEPGLKLRLVRRRAAPAAPVPVPIFIAGASGAAGAAAQTGPAQPPSVAAEGMPPGAFAVKSSMMGIFYRAPSPSSPPFVKEGDVVKPGQVLCIIEAMKVFNELKAEAAGTVIKVLSENGKPVKAGQDVFWMQRA
ncbi:MAG: acetyl-CoA carboxylase [Elusimicrobia bacterium]|nr:acetyl-CoA carboxylase [Elusimicrobiota bacterium]